MHIVVVIGTNGVVVGADGGGGPERFMSRVVV